MRRTPKFLLVVFGVVFTLGLLMGWSYTVRASGSSERIIARSQFRRTVDPSPEGPVGTLLLVEDGAQQYLRIQIDNLPEYNLSIQVCPTNSYVGTNTPVYYISTINRTGAKLGNWLRKLTGTSGAPPEFQNLGFDNLSDLSQFFSIQIASPGTTNVIGGTNSYDCIQVVSNNQTYVTCVTNVVGGVTNYYVNSYVWAPIPPVVANPSIFNLSLKTKMVVPPIPPSPNASGTIRLTYSGSSGRSLVDIEGTDLTKGQSYSLWVSDSGTNYDAGAFDLLGDGAGIRYRRDTQKGDPLPVQVPDTSELTGRVFQVQDSFGAVHLQGNFP